jgi:hypothetical protein
LNKLSNKPEGCEPKPVEDQQSTVRMEAVVDVSGRVVHARITKSVARIDRSCIDSIRGLAFSPTVADSKAVVPNVHLICKQQIKD